MRQQQVMFEISFVRRVLVLVAFTSAGLVGCQAEAPASGPPPGQVAQATTACVELQGLAHCALGAARLTSREDEAALEITGMVSAESDGVSISLPSVTSFTAGGAIRGLTSSTAIHARALEDGRTLSTLRLERTARGYVVSSMFTGSDLGRYRVNLYRDEVLIGTRRRAASDPGLELRITDGGGSSEFDSRGARTPRFRNLQTGPNSGACVWEVAFVAATMQVVDDRGELVVADRLELEEEVVPGGSYPYLSFDRLDYTMNAASMLIEHESYQ
jgi:hypothetical protein